MEKRRKEDKKEKKEKERRGSALARRGIRYRLSRGFEGNRSNFGRGRRRRKRDESIFGWRSEKKTSNAFPSLPTSPPLTPILPPFTFRRRKAESLRSVLRHAAQQQKSARLFFLRAPLYAVITRPRSDLIASFDRYNFPTHTRTVHACGASSSVPPLPPLQTVNGTYSPREFRIHFVFVTLCYLAGNVLALDTRRELLVFTRRGDRAGAGEKREKTRTRESTEFANRRRVTRIRQVCFRAHSTIKRYR